MAGYYVLKKAANGEYMFNLKAGNHEVILTSETYSSKQAAQGGIASVQRNSPVDSNYERKTAANGSPFFVLKSPANGQTRGRSELYSSASAMEKGIESVKANGPSTDIREE
jgi:uncharacterized protein YegP (UPF0339 family)